MDKPDPLLVTRSADRFAALGAGPRLAILRLLLAAHPTGMIAGEAQEELGIPASTLTHHLEKLQQVGLVNVRRVGTFLWYSANTAKLFRAGFESIDSELTRVYRNQHKKIAKAKTRNRKQRKSASALRAALDSPAAVDSAGLFPRIETLSRTMSRNVLFLCTANSAVRFLPKPF